MAAREIGLRYDRECPAADADRGELGVGGEQVPRVDDRFERRLENP
jgi:hypothetical protein